MSGLRPTSRCTRHSSQDPQIVKGWSKVRAVLQGTLLLDAQSLRDGNSDFFAFSTGRRGLTSLHTVFTLRPRHDPFQYFYQIARSFIELDYKVTDTVELEFKFKEPVGKDGAVPECVWAIVAKDEMKRLRNERWDLVRLASILPSTPQPA